MCADSPPMPTTTARLSLSYTPHYSDPLHCVAVFNGMQENIDELPPLELWTLTHAVPSLLVGSTYVRATIERALARCA